MEHSPHAMGHTAPRAIDGAHRRSALDTLVSILPFLWPADQRGMRVRVVVAILSLVLGRSANVYGPIVLKDLIDGLESTVRSGAVLAIEGLTGLALLYGIMVLLPGLLTEIRAAAFTPVSEHAQRVFALRTFEHLHNLSMRFHLDRHTGGLSRAIERGTRALQQLTGLFAFNIAPTLFEVLAVGLYLWFSYPFKYVLVIIVAVTAYIAFTLLFTEWRTKFRRAMVAEESRAMTIGVDSLLNFETVKYFGNERFESDRYNESLVNYMNASVLSQNTLGILNGGQVLVRVFCQVAILLLAIQDYRADQLTTGEVVMLNTFMLQLFIPLGFLGSSYRMIRQALVDMEFMFQLLSLKPEIQDKPHAPDLELHSARVSFEKVNFYYDATRPILHDIEFTIEPGTTVAVVGPSGAGKSTLSRLLYRFYDVQSGAICIDGQDIASISQLSLRNIVGIVPQDTVLFNDTIGFNIRYGKPGATDEEMEQAARMSAIHEFILSLPDGYETRVGERGLKLSGGEKQRVAIARTILKNPPILVLDEATSALDIGTEQDIQAALQDVSKNRTTLVIAHRLSTITHANEILVMDEGRIIERGTHDQLITYQGMYADMWQRQKAVADELRKIKETFGNDDLRDLQLETTVPQ